jgi:hypothetical protein
MTKSYLLSKVLILLIIAPLFLSCSTTKTVKFTQKTDEIVNTKSLKEYLSENENPKIVLRVTRSEENVTENEENDYLFNAIENQLLESGFIVRDRQLFTQIISNMESSDDYKNLKEKSDTDLIIELIKIKRDVEYTTNKYIDDKGREKTEVSVVRKKYGATIEFKVILINSNEFAGLYKFNYTPCTDGCIVSGPVRRMTRPNSKDKAFEGVEFDELEAFVKDATKKLVGEMRN